MMERKENRLEKGKRKIRTDELKIEYNDPIHKQLCGGRGKGGGSVLQDETNKYGYVFKAAISRNT